MIAFQSSVHSFPAQLPTCLSISDPEIIFHVSGNAASAALSTEAFDRLLAQSPELRLRAAFLKARLTSSYALLREDLERIRRSPNEATNSSDNPRRFKNPTKPHSKPSQR